MLLCFEMVWEVHIFLLWKVFTLHKFQWDDNSWKLEQNPLNSKISSKLSLLVSPLSLQRYNAQVRPKGSKKRGYIRSIGEFKLKSHQINGSLSLGNIIVHLPLPQLMTHFGTLHWQMDNFGFPYLFEMRFGA